MAITIQIRNYNEQQASLYIGMSRSFLRQARMNGNLEGKTPGPKFHKIGRAVRYDKADLDTWCEQFQKLG